MTIGICDYGIGGISLYLELKAQSSVDVIYLSDTGVLPYGKLSEHELRARVEQVIAYLFDQGADVVAIACNAASTVAPKLPNVIDIIQFGIASVEADLPQYLGVVGGFRTIESEIYKQPLSEKIPMIHQEVAQALSVRIEAGDVHSQGMKEDLERVFRPLESCEAVLLGCTHYPVLTDQIQAVIPHVRLIDPMRFMVEAIRTNFPDLNGTNTTRWLTTGSTQKMKVAAEKAFDIDIPAIETIKL